MTRFWPLIPQTPAPKASGFSLVEVLMQLVILSIVTVPMLMLMQLQKHNLMETRANLMNRMMANQMFDNQFLPDTTDIPAVTYPSTPTSGAAALGLISTRCDPLSHEKTPDEYVKTCCMVQRVFLEGVVPGQGAPPCVNNPNHIYNRDVFKPPFFRRTNSNTAVRPLQTTVELYNDYTYNNVTPPQPYYRAHRTYNLDNYNYDFANMYLCSSGMSPGEYTTQMRIDEMGDLWMPICWSGQSLPARPTTVLPSPFNRYVQSTNNGTVTQALGINGAVSPNTLYVVSLYAVAPTSATSGCLNNTSGVSCSVGNFLVYTSTAPHPGFSYATLTPTAAPIKAVRTMDIEALGNLGENGEKGIVVTLTFRTPPNAKSMRIAIPPAEPDSGITTINLSGISIYRPQEQ